MQRAALRGAVASSVGKGVFHVRTRPAEQPMTILKYRLQPQYTPIPLRFRYASSCYLYNLILNWGRNTSSCESLFLRHDLSKTCHWKRWSLVIIISIGLYISCTLLHKYLREFSVCLLSLLVSIHQLTVYVYVSGYLHSRLMFHSVSWCKYVSSPKSILC